MVIASRSDAIQARSDIVKAGNDRCHGCCQTLTIQTNHKETDDGDHHIGDQISVQIIQHLLADDLTIISYN